MRERERERETDRQTDRQKGIDGNRAMEEKEERKTLTYLN